MVDEALLIQIHKIMFNSGTGASPTEFHEKRFKKIIFEFIKK